MLSQGLGYKLFSLVYKERAPTQFKSISAEEELGEWDDAKNTYRAWHKFVPAPFAVLRKQGLSVPWELASNPKKYGRCTDSVGQTGLPPATLKGFGPHPQSTARKSRGQRSTPRGGKQ